MLKLVKKRDSLFFKLIVISVTTSFMVTSVPEYTWAHFSSVLLTDFVSCQKVVGNLYILQSSSKLISPTFFMKQINNEAFKQEVITAFNASRLRQTFLNPAYITRNSPKKDSRQFNPQESLNFINRKVYKVAEEVLRTILSFNVLHLQGVRNSFKLDHLRRQVPLSLSHKGRELKREASMEVLLNSGLSVDVIQESVACLKKFGLPINVMTILTFGRFFLCSSRDVIQTRRRIVARKKNRVNRKTRMKEYREERNSSLRDFTKVILKGLNKIQHIISLPQGIRGSPKIKHQSIRLKRTPEQQDGSEDEGDPPCFIHSLKIIPQQKQIFKNLKIIDYKLQITNFKFQINLEFEIWSLKFDIFTISHLPLAICSSEWIYNNKKINIRRERCL